MNYTQRDVEMGARQLARAMGAQAATVQFGNESYKIASVVTITWSDGEVNTLRLRGTKRELWDALGHLRKIARIITERNSK